MPQTGPSLRILTYSAGPGSRVVTVQGEVDVATRESFTAALLAAADNPGGGRLLVDLSEVTFFGADGAAALAQARADAAASGTIIYVAADADTPAGRVLNLIDRLQDADGDRSCETQRDPADP